jgi:hypothetical protein
LSPRNLSPASSAARARRKCARQPSGAAELRILGGVGSLNDLDFPSPHALERGAQFVDGIAAVGEDMSQPRIQGMDRGERKGSAMTGSRLRLKLLFEELFVGSYNLTEFERRTILPDLPNKSRGVARVDDRCVLTRILGSAFGCTLERSARTLRATDPDKIIAAARRWHQVLD